MKYTFTPSHPGAVAYAYQGGPLLKSGDPVEMDPAQADRLCGIVAGANGGPCLIPLDEAPGAVSEPTTFNPEMPAAAVSVPSTEPVKRKPGRPKKDPA